MTPELEAWLTEWIPRLAAKAHRRWPFADRDDIEQEMWLYALISRDHCEALLTRGLDGERILSFELDKHLVRVQAKSDNGYEKAVREINGEAYENPYHGQMLNLLMRSLVQAGMALDGAVDRFRGDRNGGRVDHLREMLDNVSVAYSALDVNRREIIAEYYGERRLPATDAERQRMARAMKQLRWTLYRMLKEAELRYDYDSGEEAIAA